MKERTIFSDPDPTHYIDIGLSKDGKYLIINSNTKEDSEVWVLDRLTEEEQVLPINIMPRKPSIKAHIDHLRDFFIMITNHGVKSKNYKITTLNDTDFKASSI
jgi:protease II